MIFAPGHGRRAELPRSRRGSGGRRRPWRQWAAESDIRGNGGSDPLGAAMPTTLRKSADPLAASADLLVVCVPAPPSLDGPAAALDAALGGVVARAIKDGEIDGKPRSSTVFHGAGGLAAPRAVVVGVGEGGADDWRAARLVGRPGGGEGPRPQRRARPAARGRRGGGRRPDRGPGTVSTASTATRRPERPSRRHAAGAEGGGPLPRAAGRRRAPRRSDHRGRQRRPRPRQHPVQRPHPRRPRRAC